jgi:hypothetical protein
MMLITDHALVRYLERVGGLDVEALRSAIAQSLARAELAAREIGETTYTVRTAHHVFIIEQGRLITVMPAEWRRR